MSRLAQLREEIAKREAELAKLEMSYNHADDSIKDIFALAIDQTSDELFQLRAAADEIEEDIAMRENRRDRAYGRWMTS